MNYEKKLNGMRISKVEAGWCPCKGGCTLSCSGSCSGACSTTCMGDCSGTCQGDCAKNAEY